MARRVDLDPLKAGGEPRDLTIAGKNTVRVEVTGKNQFPYTLGWSYQTLKPATDARAQLKLSTSLSQAQAPEGGRVLRIEDQDILERLDGAVVVAACQEPLGIAEEGSRVGRELR